MRLAANGKNYTFAFPVAVDPHFTDFGGMEGWIGWLHT